MIPNALVFILDLKVVNGLCLLCTEMILTANLMDIYMLDPAGMIWEDLSNIATGEKPRPRDSFGIATVSNKIYIFGGVFRKGVLNLKRSVFCVLMFFF